MLTEYLKYYSSQLIKTQERKRLSTQIKDNTNFTHWNQVLRITER